ncbi:Gp2 [Mycolicibacterium canariasense]|uniref:Gp2 n=1 Tax=Mycolicibacterium canariasense TaxID=228230 RepID=A0A100WCH2_MYCCR|nr:hypothetical protein [Mycolicibacterium canariasense]MCV7212791.1 hypothetical protein [Mycolicibacterium canariasense]ORV09718.1 hypothetical protein AWB94_08400 [Mycolicibacterium canariasense]GAS95646.1 Gp2 [Mycolicibacterium canariasense]
MAKYTSLNDAMVAKDELAEAEIRYRLLAETFEEKPQLRANLNPALERAKAEILRLRAVKKTPGAADSGMVVAFDAARFRRSGG